LTSGGCNSKYCRASSSIGGGNGSGSSPADEERAEPQRGVDLGRAGDGMGGGHAANGDFLLARVAAGGELVDLTDEDIRLWMFWLGLDYILNR
jgi:hypothetical protein